MGNEDRDHCLEVTAKGGETITLVGSAYLHLRGIGEGRADITYRPDGWDAIRYKEEVRNGHLCLVMWGHHAGADRFVPDEVVFDGALTIHEVPDCGQYERQVVAEFRPGEWVECENAGSIESAREKQ